MMLPDSLIDLDATAKAAALPHDVLARLHGYWAKGTALITRRLCKSTIADPADAPIALDERQAEIWHAAQAEAYRDALEMMGVPDGAPAADAKPSNAEHWAIEQVKRHIIKAMVDQENGKGMSVSARIAADAILELLVPNEQHRKYEG